MSETNVKDFIKTVADTQVKKDLVIFFHQNPCMDDCKGLSVWVNQSAGEIAAEIDDLVYAGVLRKDGDGPSAIYSYDPQPEIRDLVREFVRFYREERDTVQAEIATLQAQMDRVRTESLREIQREQSRTKTIIASMADGVIVADPEGIVILYNPAAAVLLGWDNRSALGRPFPETIDADSRVRNDSLTPLTEKLNEIREHPHRIVSTELALEQPRPMTLKANLSSVVDAQGERLGTVIVLRDVTEFKELDKAKNDFISMVSHELRSPLTSIKGFLLSILRGLYGDVTAKQREPLTIIQEQSERLLSLINDLLEITRGEMKFCEQRMEPIQIGEVLLSCIVFIKVLAEEKNIVIEKAIPDHLPMIDADRENIEKVFSNLIGNAVKYTPNGGTVTVTASDFGTHLQVCVADTGIGIAAEALPHIFEKFYRVKDEKTREILGTGLGLTIVKNIVDAHMGTINVESEVGSDSMSPQGSKFTVLLPKHEVAERDASDSQSPVHR
ncbi:MAG: hypothetical protein AUJ92_12925 [Armatimonadetes bacterium CG2_30_59_28]|nr:PAS domain-containing protein [Armatimonadota bacterium]OIO93123.1 MAG: hypothetical protein AUJ92_12925 [Armatimonadetes bacterium CG2_30_59_28]PIU67175.1 MAG: hybrid sensor histidine kinase/response regulator [Armatimonadetes bacterium CG07_land_8_20_14_0_80_59_28]PIX45526.1 MAG: hybrid sensor histidine kinase/response regulator [Armatimonadetes bacterium CG_4_8_14_3_um_filter_58_9]